MTGSELLADIKALGATYLRGSDDLEEATRAVKGLQGQVEALQRRTLALEEENSVRSCTPSQQVMPHKTRPLYPMGV